MIQFGCVLPYFHIIQRCLARQKSIKHVVVAVRDRPSATRPQPSHAHGHKELFDYRNPSTSRNALAMHLGIDSIGAVLDTLKLRDVVALAVQVVRAETESTAETDHYAFRVVE